MSERVKKFKGKIVQMEGALGWRIVRVPFDVKEAFGSAARVPVRGTVNGFAFRTSIFPMGGGEHILMINKEMQRGSGATHVGDVVSVELEVDTEERKVTIPVHFRKILVAEDGLLQYFASFNYSTQKYMIDQVNEPKSAEARMRRAEQLAMRLLEIKDGEEEAPPMLQVAFRSNAKAKQGWDLMPPSHRRTHLWRIYLTQNLELRAKKVQQALELMAEYAEKRKTKSEPKTERVPKKAVKTAGKSVTKAKSVSAAKQKK